MYISAILRSGFAAAFFKYFCKCGSIAEVLRKDRSIAGIRVRGIFSLDSAPRTPKLLHPEIAEPKSSGPKVTPHGTTLADYSKEIPDQSSGQVPAKSEGLPTNLCSLPTMAEGLPTMADSLPTMLDGMPANLITEIQALGLRSPPSDIQAVVARLCSIRPFTADDLAQILQRNKKWVKSSYLAPLNRDEILEYTIPGSPKHPNQAYYAKKRNEYP